MFMNVSIETISSTIAAELTLNSWIAIYCSEPWLEPAGEELYFLILSWWASLQAYYRDKISINCTLWNVYAEISIM